MILKKKKSTVIFKIKEVSRLKFHIGSQTAFLDIEQSGFLHMF